MAPDQAAAASPGLAAPAGLAARPASPDRAGDIWWTVVLALAVLILAAPTWSVLIPPLPDYLDHLARLDVLAHGAADPVLRQLYRAEWAPIPNLAMDLVGLPLAKLLPIEDAGRVFVTLCLASWVAGPLAVHWALYRRLGLGPLLAVFFVLNASFFFGFLNFVFGVGLAYLTLAAWVATDGWGPGRRLPMLAALATAVYLAHLLAFLVLGLFVLGYELALAGEQGGLRPRPLLARLVPPGACFLPAVGLYLLARPRTPGEQELVFFHSPMSLLLRWSAAVWTSFGRPDFLVLGALAVLAALLLLAGAATVHRRARPALVLVAVAALLMPETALGGWGAFLRLPAVAGALLFASLDVRLSRPGAAALAVAALVVLGYRATSLAEVWRGYDRQLGEFRAALTGLEGDAPRLLMAVNRTDKWHDWMYDHIGSLGIIDRHAYVSILYSIPGQQVVRSAGPLAPAAPTTTEGYEPVDAPYLGALAGAPGAPAVPEVWRYLRDWPCHFDYAAVLGPDRGNPAPAYLAQVKVGSFFTLYRVRPADRCPAVGSTSPARR